MQLILFCYLRRLLTFDSSGKGEIPNQDVGSTARVVILDAFPLCLPAQDFPWMWRGRQKEEGGDLNSYKVTIATFKAPPSQPNLSLVISQRAPTQTLSRKNLDL